jgi:hypothetical protein
MLSNDFFDRAIARWPKDYIDVYGGYAIKLLRLQNEMIQTFERYRRGNKQTVEVRHVHIHGSCKVPNTRLGKHAPQAGGVTPSAGAICFAWGWSSDFPWGPTNVGFPNGADMALACRPEHCRMPSSCFGFRMRYRAIARWPKDYIDVYGGYAIKLLRLQNEMIQTFERYRRGNKQTVEVRHVHIHGSCKVPNTRLGKHARAKQIAHAPQPAVWSADKERQPLRAG